jgi:ADP-ribosylglycohydrolase
MGHRLHDKVYGCLVGAAVGDAMGAAVENMHYLDIREQYGKVEGFLEYEAHAIGGRPSYETYSMHWHERKSLAREEPHPFGAWRLEAGVYTDDMRFRLLGIRSFLKRRRRITGREFAEDLIQYRLESASLPQNDPRRIWADTMFILDELVQMCLKSPFGHTILVGGVWGSPGGIINAGDPRAGAQDGGLIGAIVAQAMHPEATVDSVIQTAFDYADALPDGDYGPLPTWASGFRTRLERAMRCADQSGDVFELIVKLYEWLCATCPPFSVQNVFEALVAALAMVYKSKGDFRQAVVGSVNFGRDCDTIAAIAGEILGALHGIACVPKEWVEVIERENPEPRLREVASEVAQVLLEEAERTRRIADALISMG